MAKTSPDWRERARTESRFYNAQAAREADRDLRVRENPNHPTQGIGLSLLRDNCQIGPLEGAAVLDCGCGTGITSVILAREGARVFAFDVSPRRLALALRRSAVNGVAEQVSFQAGAFEQLCYQSDSFRLVFGMHVLHHVDVRKAADEAYRVLRPGGKAIFWEPLDRNPILRHFRRYAGKFGIAKWSSPREHPLRDQDLEALRAAFGGRLRVHNTGFLFFSLIDRNVLQFRSRMLSRLLRGLDFGVAKYLPGLRKYSYVALLELTK